MKLLKVRYFQKYFTLSDNSSLPGGTKNILHLKRFSSLELAVQKLERRFRSRVSSDKHNLNAQLGLRTKFLNSSGLKFSWTFRRGDIELDEQTKFYLVIIIIIFIYSDTLQKQAFRHIRKHTVAHISQSSNKVW